MGNRPYLRTILGGKDFGNLSLKEKIIYANNMLLWLCKRHVRTVWNRRTCFTHTFTDIRGSD